MLLSAANCYRHNAAGVTNITLDAALARNEENFEKTARLLETYFQMGGGQFQLNYLSKEELLEAQAKPEEHSSLRVRVSGFSDFFNNLPTSAQNDVIERTSHSV